MTRGEERDHRQRSRCGDARGFRNVVVVDEAARPRRVTAWLSGAQKSSTGRPVPLLVDFLINRVRAL